jgi:Tubulin-tyrosine ligase family
MAFKASSESIAKQSREIGFELLGFDFMIDSELNTYLIEVNTNPCLSTLSESQGALINKLVQDTLRIAVIPTFGLLPKEDIVHGVADPQACLTDFELIHNYFF